MTRLFALGLLLAGCGGPARPPGSSDGGSGVLREAGVKGGHVSSCSDVACGNGVNPPLGGDHCGLTLACRKYDTEQPRCVWIHNLEHGHAVLAYNCPSGCPELVEKLNGVWASQTVKRILVTPDSKLPFKMAAIVWGFGWQGDSFDAAAVNAVLSHQDAEAPEPGFGCSQ